MQLHILSSDPTSLVATALFLCSPFLAKLLEKVIYTYVLPPSLSLPFALERSGPSPSFLELATAALVRVRGDLHAAEPEVSSQVPFDMIHQQLRGFPGGASGKEPACQCRRHRRRGFDRWIVKIPWRRAWQPTPVSLPEESHGWRNLAGYGPWGGTEPDTTERHTQCIRRGSSGPRAPSPLTPRAPACPSPLASLLLHFLSLTWGSWGPRPASQASSLSVSRSRPVLRQ